MNRTVAQAAGVLGVDASKVKQWALVFEDYLSDAANPPKGTVRMFSDGDLMVLCYVWHEWEDNPDIEAIKIGLNLGNHFEEPFVQHLYLHTPLLQEPPDGLGESWRHGILICGVGGRHGYLELARNYRHVAESMLQSALDKNELDGWAYPILFAYRHTLELYLKLIGEVDEITHSIRDCVKLVEKRRGVKFPSPIREWMLELEQIDPAGTAFRYADEVPGPNGYGEHWFDFAHFQFAMKLIFDMIDRAVLKSGAQGKPARKKR